MSYERNLVHYYEIREGRTDNFLAKYLNYDLLENLNPFTEQLNVFNEFSEKHNLRYFGELIERFDERNIVKDIKDLRTLVFLASVVIHRKPNYYNTNQAQVFVSKVVEKLRKEFDFISSSLLLAFTDEQLSDNDRDYLIKSVFDAINTDTSLSFEEKILGSFSILYSNEITMREEYKEDVSNLFFDSVIQPEELLFKEDYFIYTVLLKMFNELNLLKQTKLFKNKVDLKFYKALMSLAKKEIKDDKVENLLKDLNNMDYGYCMYYNYTLSDEFDFTNIKSSVSLKGYIRIANKMLSLLSQKDAISESIINIIRNEIANHAYSQFKYSSNKRDKAIDDFFYDYTGEISRENFDAFLKIANIQDNKVFTFLVKENFHFLLEEKNKDLFDKLTASQKLFLIQEGIEKSDDLDKITYLYETLFLSIPKVKVDDLNESVLNKLFLHGLIDTFDKNLWIKRDTLLAILKYWQNNLIDKDYLNNLKEVLSYIDDLPFSNVGKKYAFLTLNNKIDTLRKIVFDTLSTYSIKQIKDDSIACEFYELLDDLVSMIKNRVEYYRYLSSNLTNKHYLKVFKISNEDKIKIYKALYEATCEYVIKERSITNYDSDITSDANKFANSIKELALTSEEIDELNSIELKEKEDSIIKRLEKENDEYSFLNHLEEVKTLDGLSKSKEIFLDKISDEKFDLCFGIRRIFSILKEFNSKNMLEDEDILNVAKKIIEINK